MWRPRRLDSLRREMRERAACARGQTAVEYAGLLTLVATILLALFTLDIPRHLSDAVSDGICRLAGGNDCGSDRGAEARTRLSHRLDPDGDGLTTKQERALGTLPDEADSDGDGIDDGDEAARKLNPRSRDTDRDGIEDARELALQRTKRTDPRKADSDGDGLLDGAELAAGTPAWSADGDTDGLGGRTDGLSDFEEIYRYGTDPTRIDTDGDGVGDGDEVRAGTNPLVDERSLGDKIGPEVAGILLDDPFSFGKGGLAKKLGKGAEKLAAKIGIRFGRKAEKAITDTAENAAAAQRRRSAASRANPGVQRAVSRRASEVHEALDPIAQRHRTTAVLRTDGESGTVDVLAAGKRDLSPAQRDAALPGEVLAKNPGEHAEITALHEAQARGLTPREIATTTDICPACQRELEASGATIIDKRTAVWPRKP